MVYSSDGETENLDNKKPRACGPGLRRVVESEVMRPRPGRRLIIIMPIIMAWALWTAGVMRIDGEQCQPAEKKQGRRPNLVERLQTEQMKFQRVRVYSVHVAERSHNYAKSIGTADEENRHSRGQRASSPQLKCRRSLRADGGFSF